MITQPELSDLQLIFDKLPSPISVIGLNDQLLFCNKSAKPFWNDKSTFSQAFQLSEQEQEKFVRAKNELENKGKTELDSKIADEHGNITNYKLRITWLNNTVKQGAGIMVIMDKKDDQIVQLEKDIAKIKKEFDDFSYIISHDIQAPVRSVQSLATWLLEDYKSIISKEGEELFNHLQNNIKHLQRLIVGVLEYSKIGKSNTKPTIVDTSFVIKEVIKHIDHENKVTLEIAENLPVITADEDKIYQLFNFLLDNAIRFCDKNPGKVEITCDTTPKGIHIQIIDNGIGIEEKYFDRIFKIFRTIAKEKDHIGIGLTLSRKIVEQHNGTLWIESTPKVGTSVHILFPVSMLSKV